MTRLAKQLQVGSQCIAGKGRMHGEPFLVTMDGSLVCQEVVVIRDAG